MSDRTAWVLVALMIAAAGALRITMVLGDPSFSLEDDSGLYWSESATQYRHARMVAETGRLPRTDLRAESPEGLQVDHHFTVLMEATAGWLSRAAMPARVPFHVFLAVFLAAISCLSGASVYGLSRQLSGSPAAGLLATALYLTNLSVASSTLTHQVLLEDFALPFYFAHLALLVAAWQRDSFSHALWSGCLLYGALAAWHVAPFALWVELAALAPVVLFGAADRALARSLATVAAVAALAGLTLPTLRAQGFLLSLPFTSLVGLAAAAWVRLRAPGRLPGLAAFAAPVAIAVGWGRLHQHEFSHAYSLVLAKLRWLGQPPADPTRLGWETAVMWTSSFLSPSWAGFWLFLGFLALAALAGLALRLARPRAWTGAEVVLLLLTFAYALLYALIERMDCFAAFFLAVAAGELARPGRAALAGRLSTLLGLGLVGANVWALAHTPIYGTSAPAAPLLGLIKAVRHQVPEEAPILAEFPLGPALLAATERPVLLHSKFETRSLRAKVEQFERSLFTDEEGFWRFCLERGARYFVYNANMATTTDHESIRYRIDHLGPVTDSAAYAFHFSPQRLRHFQLVWNNSHYQLFEVLPADRAPVPVEREYFRVFDAASTTP